MNTILNENNKDLYISLNAPYKNIKKLISYEDSLYANSIYYNLDKLFRFSYNNISYSNWIELTNENLRYISISYGEDFWIEYHYHLNSIEQNESVEFRNVLLEVITDDQITQKQICSIKTSPECSSASNSITNAYCTTNLYNPYDYGNAPALYNQLSVLVNNIYGQEVEYYKTNPILNTRDVILEEYSIHNVEAKQCIKVMIPDNTMPTRDVAYNSNYGLGMPDLFEIHIVRTEFERVFGDKERPRTEDYIYFPAMKKIYDVNSIMFADENALNTYTYYKVNLKEHDEKANRKDVNNLEKDLRSQFNTFDDLFGQEVADEQEKVSKTRQYDSIDKNKDGSDIIRSYIDKRVVITPQNYINTNTYQVVSDFYYDFSVIPGQENVIKYLNNKVIPNTFAITYLLNIKELPKFYNKNIAIKNITQATNYDIYPTALLVETLDVHNLKDGDVINIKNSTYYNGLNYVLSVMDSNRFIVSKEFDGFAGGAINKVYDKQAIISNENVSIFYIDSFLVVKLNNKVFFFDCTLYVDKWLGFVINYSAKFNQLAVFVYDNFVNIYSKVLNNIEIFTFNSEDIYLISGKYKLTNIRIFRECIELEQQVSILSQNVVIDSHLALIIDNARPQMRLPKHYAK